MLVRFLVCWLVAVVVLGVAAQLLAQEQLLQLITIHILIYLVTPGAFPLPIVIARDPDSADILTRKAQTIDMYELHTEFFWVPNIAGVEPGNEIAVDAVEKSIARVWTPAVFRVSLEDKWQRLVFQQNPDVLELLFRRSIIDDDEPNVTGPCLIDDRPH